MTTFHRIGLAIKVSPDGTQDVALDSDGNLSMVHDAEAVGQHVRQRLGAYSGEWFLDTTAGLPWLNDILGKAYDPAIAEALVKAEILDTEGVTEITSFSVGFDRRTRGLSIRSVTVLSEYDEEVSI